MEQRLYDLFLQHKSNHRKLQSHLVDIFHHLASCFQILILEQIYPILLYQLVMFLIVNQD